MRIIPSAPNHYAGGDGLESARPVQVYESSHAHWNLASGIRVGGEWREAVRDAMKFPTGMRHPELDSEARRVIPCWDLPEIADAVFEEIPRRGAG
jgi:hypothetical protein